MISITWSYLPSKNVNKANTLIGSIPFKAFFRGYLVSGRRREQAVNEGEEYGTLDRWYQQMFTLKLYNEKFTLDSS